MIENPQHMTTKGIFRVITDPKIPDEVDLLETLHGFAYDYLRSQYGFEPDFAHFCTYGKFASDDDAIRVRIGSTRETEDEPYPFLWALRIQARDRFSRRRNWLTHIGIRQDDPTTATLYFAEFCSDYIVGQMTEAPPPTAETPALFDALLRSRRLLCLSGARALAPDPWAITDDDINPFLDLLFDPDRTLPILMITCPDLVSPGFAFERVKGNLIVCWLDDYPLLCSINEQLPAALQLGWDTIRVYMPIAREPQTHPILSVREISRLGETAVVENLRRAFCSCLRTGDRHAFVTVDTIRELLRERAIASLKEKSGRDDITIAHLGQENAELFARRKELTEQLKDAQTRLENSETAEYEALLAEALDETCRIEQGVDALIAQLYGDPNTAFSSPETASTAKLRDLCEALNFRFHRDRRR